MARTFKGAFTCRWASTSVLRIDNYYLCEATGAIPTANDSRWVLLAEGDTAPVPTSAAPYLWHKTVTVMSDGTSTSVIEFGGSMGQNGIDYDLVPTASSILKDAEGNVTPDRVGCTLIRRNADGTATRVGLPDGYTAKVQYDNGTEEDYTIISVGRVDKLVGDATTITFLLYYGNVVIERHNINVISEGAQGLDGRGIQSQDYRFKALASNSVPTVPSDNEWDSEWYALSSAGYSTEKPYLFRCTKTTYVDGNGNITTEYAVDGPTVWGDKGDTGNGIKSEVVKYTVWTSSTEQPTGIIWNVAGTQTIANLKLPKDFYVWTRTETTYTDGTTAYTGVRCMGSTEDFIAKNTAYALGDSGTDYPESGWATTYTATENKWLWERTEYCWTTNGHTFDYKCKGYFAKNGTNGVAGMIMRVTEWQEDTEYHNDENLETSPRYLDIVTVTDSATGNFTAYQCKLSHKSDSGVNPPGNEDYWTEMNNMRPIYTSLIVADKAVMRLSQTNQINIVNSDSKVQGSFGGVDDETNGYPLWMGGETANDAKFKVKYDGTLEATGAKIEGEVNATSGTIGGFTLSQGKIGVGTDSDTTEGLGITNQYIRFANKKQKVLLGCLSTYGTPYNGYYSLTSEDGTTLELHHDIPSGYERYEPLSGYRPKALDVYGNVFVKGKQALFERGYIGTAYSDTIQTWFSLTHKFQFESNSVTDASKYLTLYLPSKTDIISLMSNDSVMFDLEIVCGSGLTNYISIQPDTNNTTTLFRPRHLKVSYGYDFDLSTYTYTHSIVSAGTVASYKMYAGDHLRLRYCNGVYYMLTDRTETHNFSGGDLT